MIKISVVIPVYNMGNHIEKTVESFLNQTYTNYEIILVNDGSTDDSGKICDNLEKRYSKIRTIHTQNQGSGTARNIGIKNAVGDYIYFPDADDLVDKNAFEIMANVLEKNKYDLLVFGYRNVDTYGYEIKTKKYPNVEKNAEVLRSNYIDCFFMDSIYGIQGAPWNKLFNLKIIKENNIYYPPLRRHQDDAFIGRYVSYIKNVKFLEEVLYTYYVNDLEKEWDKYPKNYIDSVIGLYECRKENILIWNSNDTMTHDAVNLTYITGVIKSLELFFSKKYGFNKKERKEHIDKIINLTLIKKMDISKKYSMKYQRIILWLIKNDYKNILYVMLNFKVIIEKNFKNLFKLIKKYERG